MDLSNEIKSTFSASIRSVGTACTLASVGIYIHRRGFLQDGGKRALALVSQQVTIPLLFFTKIIYCNQDWSDDPCPDVMESLWDVWMLLLWPAYVVAVGLFVGYTVAVLTRTPRHQVRAVVALCAFGNSTGLPITLLTVVHANFPTDTNLGRIDPCLFLSVYLLLYPVLQWGVGGWLLAPEDKEEKDDSNGNEVTYRDSQTSHGRLHHQKSRLSCLAHNVLNQGRHHTPGESKDILYSTIEMGQRDNYETSHPIHDCYQEKASLVEDAVVCSNDGVTLELACQTNLKKKRSDPEIVDDESTCSDVSGESPMETIKLILGRCVQPPVIGALLGMLVASQPWLRGIFVDLDHRDDDAPLEWLFDGLYAMGQAAVPINMIILGCNLSASFPPNDDMEVSDERPKPQFPCSTTVAVVIGKLIVMPLVGFLSALFCHTYLWQHLPSEISGSFYLVILIVFLTPTANNVMVMVELSGSGSKEGIARIIAWQYAAAPIVLSLTMTAAVRTAEQWS